MAAASVPGDSVRSHLVTDLYALALSGQFDERVRRLDFQSHIRLKLFLNNPTWGSTGEIEALRDRITHLGEVSRHPLPPGGGALLPCWIEFFLGIQYFLSSGHPPQEAKQERRVGEPIDERLVERTYESDLKKEGEGKMYALGKVWWKTVIDLDCQHLGPYVFDRSRKGYKRSGEPGYFAAIEKAYFFAARYLEAHPQERPTVDLYRNIHRLATANFVRSGHQLGTSAEVSGQMRGTFVSADFDDGNFPKWVQKRWGDEAFERGYIEAIEGQLPSPPLPLPIEKLFLELIDDPRGSRYIRILYPMIGSEATLQSLFAQFGEQMDALAGEEEKLRLIAAFWQKLEWLHPFPDGQGRSDLIFLSYLLVRYGFSPAILEKPYFSSTAPLDDWVEHLKEGMKRWQGEKEKM